MNDTDNPIVDMLTVRRDLYLVMSLLLADERVAKVHNVVVWTRDFHENEVRRDLCNNPFSVILRSDACPEPLREESPVQGLSTTAPLDSSLRSE